MKIKAKCIKNNVDVVDIKTAPKTTPTQFKINEMKSIRAAPKKY
jgi:hypothetical protein